MGKTPNNALKQVFKKKIKILAISLFFILSSLININIVFANDIEPKGKQSSQEEKMQMASEETERASQKGVDTEDAKKDNNGFCVCLKCGRKLPYQKGVCCRSIKCPDCSSSMVREIKRGYKQSKKGFCVCSQCGNKLPHKRGVPCQSINCSKCNIPMTREWVL